MEGKMYCNICQEKGRVLIIGENSIGWSQVNFSKDYEGRVTQSETHKIYPFRNIQHAEVKVFIKGNKQGLIQLKLFLDKKEVVIIDLNKCSGQAMADFFNKYNS